MEPDSGADSVSSTPRAASYRGGARYADAKPVVRLMCSFGGKIVPRQDNSLRYCGGDSRIVAISRSANFSTLVEKMSKILPPNYGEFSIKYQLPNEDLDSLISVSMDEDMENMLDEYDRIAMQQPQSKAGRLRLFLFSTSTTSSMTSLLDGSTKRESWFFDALNGGASEAPSLERGRSEASSVVSEIPDYLSGFDNIDDLSTKLRNRVGFSDIPGSDPSSPAFRSTSSVVPLPNLSPVKTKLENSNPNPVEETGEQVLHQGSGHGGQVWAHNSNPGTPYAGHPVQTTLPPVYYMPAGPAQGLVPLRNPQMPQYPGPTHFVQPYGPGQVQVPVGYAGPGLGQVYVRAVGGVQGQGLTGMNQPLHYGGTGMVVSYPGTVMAEVRDEAGPDASKGRTLQP